MTLKQRTIDKIIANEGGYVDDPNDSGGETNFGITEVVARNYGYTGEISELPREVAFDIYADQYWDKLRADDMLRLSESITHEIVDTGVNTGTHRAATFLQTCLNIFNNQGEFYGDIKVDGRIGSITINALAFYLDLRDESVMMKALNCLQGAFYIQLADNREKDEAFVYGWLRTRVKLVD